MPLYKQLNEHIDSIFDPSIKEMDGYFVGEHVEILSKVPEELETKNGPPKVITHVVEILGFFIPCIRMNKLTRKSMIDSEVDSNAQDLSGTTTTVHHNSKKRKMPSGGRQKTTEIFFLARYYYSLEELPYKIQQIPPKEIDQESREIYFTTLTQLIDMRLILRKCTVLHSTNTWCWKDFVVGPLHGVLKMPTNRRRKNRLQWKVPDGIFLCRFEYTPWNPYVPIRPFAFYGEEDTLLSMDFDHQSMTRAEIPPLLRKKNKNNNNNSLPSSTLECCTGSNKNIMRNGYRKRWQPDRIPPIVVDTYMATLQTIQLDIGAIVYVWNFTLKQEVQCIVKEFLGDGKFRVSFANGNKMFIANLETMRGLVGKDEALEMLSSCDYDPIKALDRVEELLHKRHVQEATASRSKTSRRDKVAAARSIAAAAAAELKEPNYTVPQAKRKRISSNSSNAIKSTSGTGTRVRSIPTIGPLNSPNSRPSSMVLG